MKPVENTIRTPKIGDKIRHKCWREGDKYYLIDKIDMVGNIPRIRLRDYNLQYRLTNLDEWEWI